MYSLIHFLKQLINQRLLNGVKRSDSMFTLRILHWNKIIVTVGFNSICKLNSLC